MDGLTDIRKKFKDMIIFDMTNYESLKSEDFINIFECVSQLDGKLVGNIVCSFLTQRIIEFAGETEFEDYLGSLEKKYDWVKKKIEYFEKNNIFPKGCHVLEELVVAIFINIKYNISNCLKDQNKENYSLILNSSLLATLK
jgi:hypothetical protein